MKTIVLAGGFAKRLWPLTKDTPKPLLDVGGKEIITRIIEKIEGIENIDEIIISTNDKFKENFNKYLENRVFIKPMKLICEPTMGEGEKLGSIGGLRYLMKETNLTDDVLIIGGDNLFGFDLASFVDFYKDQNASVIALRKIENTDEIKKFGVCTLNEENQIVEFEEKPDKPKSNLASTACYMFTFNNLKLIESYLDEGNSPDAMGSFVSWLIHKTKVCGFTFDEYWFDIGSIEGLEEARQKYGDD